MPEEEERSPDEEERVPGEKKCAEEGQHENERFPEEQERAPEERGVLEGESVPEGRDRSDRRNQEDQSSRNLESKVAIQKPPRRKKALGYPGKGGRSCEEAGEPQVYEQGWKLREVQMTRRRSGVREVQIGRHDAQHEELLHER